MDKLKLFAAGDIHGDSSLAKQLAEQAKKGNADLVVLCGDLTMADQSTDSIVGPFKKLNEKILLLPGNHEPVSTVDFLAELYNVKNLHGYSVRYKDVGIFGASAVNIGMFQMSEDQIFELLKKGFEKIKYLDKKIMVTHVHPAGTKMEKFTKFFPGSEAVRKAIEMFKPDIAICSHVHEAEGIEEMIGTTRLINVGRKGKLVEL